MAPRNSGTPIRESRMMNIGGLNASQRKSNTNTPTLLGNNGAATQAAQSQLSSMMTSNNQNGQLTSLSYPPGSNAVAMKSSFGSVVYDSNRKTRESATIDENRLKQASSLSPTRMIQDMSRQDATLLQVPASGASISVSSSTH